MHLHLSLAPIQGVTNEYYRKIFHAHFPGVDQYYAPFVRVSKTCGQRRGLRHHLPPARWPLPLVPQILSHDADEILAFDREIQTLGYAEVNWNLGCPAPMVARKTLGAGLLPHPERIAAILETVMPRLRSRLSLKLRLGWEHAGELLRLIPVLNDFPLQTLILHPRVGQQQYRGEPDLESFAECLRACRHPLVYNGDIFNLGTLRGLQARFPQVHAWMLGRGLLANPFLAAQIKGWEPRTDKLGVLARFHADYAQALAEALGGAGSAVDRLKEMWRYLHWVFVDGRAFYRKLKKTRQWEPYRRVVDDFFAGHPAVQEHVVARSEDFN